VLNLVQLTRTGQTLAKQWFGIRVVRTDGSRREPGPLIVLRCVVPTLHYAGSRSSAALFALADALFIFADDRRTLHDRIADTIVIDA
jgi:uncharacterized RDD family membrane protein YckC